MLCLAISSCARADSASASSGNSVDSAFASNARILPRIRVSASPIADDTAARAVPAAGTTVPALADAAAGATAQSRPAPLPALPLSGHPGTRRRFPTRLRTESRDLRGPAIAHRRGSVAAHLVGDHVSSHRRVRVAQFPAHVPDQLRRLPAVPPPAVTDRRKKPAISRLTACIQPGACSVASNPRYSRDCAGHPGRPRPPPRPPPSRRALAVTEPCPGPATTETRRPLRAAALAILVPLLPPVPACLPHDCGPSLRPTKEKALHRMPRGGGEDTPVPLLAVTAAGGWRSISTGRTRCLTLSCTSRPPVRCRSGRRGGVSIRSRRARLGFLHLACPMVLDVHQQVTACWVTRVPVWCGDSGQLRARPVPCSMKN